MNPSRHDAPRYMLPWRDLCKSRQAHHRGVSCSEPEPRTATGKPHLLVDHLPWPALRRRLVLDAGPADDLHQQTIQRNPRRPARHAAATMVTRHNPFAASCLDARQQTDQRDPRRPSGCNATSAAPPRPSPSASRQDADQHDLIVRIGGDAPLTDEVTAFRRGLEDRQHATNPLLAVQRLGER